MRSKKGNLSLLTPSVITLVIAAVFLVFGLIMLQELRDTSVITKANNPIIVNESVLTVNEQGDLLAGASNPSSNSFSIILVINQTGKVINSANYTLNADTGLLQATGAGPYNNSNWNVTYSYLHGDEAYTASNESIVGMGAFASFWEIIVLAIVISIIIGLLIATFGRSNQR